MGGAREMLPGLRAGRVLALLLTLAGLFGMHGLAPTSAAGAHHSPAHVVATETAPDQRQPGVVLSTLDAAETRAHGASAVPAEGGDGDRDGSHGLAGCLVVLGALTGALLVLLATARRHRTLTTRAGPTRGSGRVSGPPERPPPRWPVISLCVLRV